jgi:hypothetical protein
MRATLLVIGLLLLCAAGYAWRNNPDGCVKLGHDLVAVFQAPASTNAAPASPAAPSPDAAAPGDGLTIPASTPDLTPPPPPPAGPPNPLANWHAPDVMPAHPNWTWTTLDGTTYQNVVVTKIEPDTVSITHSLGVGHVLMVNLPPDIQKELGSSTAVARAAKDEADRENAHPYYTLDQVADAQAAARALHWPLAWMCSFLPELSVANPRMNTGTELTQMSLNYLKTRAVVIFVNGNDELQKLTWPVVRERQFFKFDDGAVPGGHHFMELKIVFTDAEIRKPLGRVSYTEMFSSREAAIDAVLNAIANNTPAPEPVAPAAPPHL